MQASSTQIRGYFADEHFRARWAVLFLYTSVGLAAISILSGFLQWELLAQMKDGIQVTKAAALANDARHHTISTVRTIMFVFSAIIFLRWLYAAYGNLELMGRRYSEETPGWAIGYWFIPIVNLVKPYSIVKELWQRSHDGNRRTPDAGSGAPAIIGIWWMLYIVAGLIERIAKSYMQSEHSVEILSYVTLVSMGSGLLVLIAGLLLIHIVNRIDLAQQNYVTATIT
jgi:Domain of unknown function (DUF4328)